MATSGKGHMRCRWMLVGILFVAFSRSVPSAQELRLDEAVQPGARLVVVDQDGVATAGRLEELGQFEIRLRVPTGTAQIAWPRVSLIRRDGDPLRDGILWGGLWGTLIALSYVSQVNCQTCSNWEAASVYLVLGGGGAALGGLFDHLRRDRSVLYREPSLARARQHQWRAGSPRLTLSASLHF